ncbi:CLIP domain-containing serine protease [Dimargaris verticillata]|uniref:CLIP domain-containing serine protease n=1 Tax=Dimargaris verticillata TaxID=2761393 RepID=A0A9W8AZK9_9FUNG|nr:CLIP domain-containing serine protease [Dimargaris verticillata]
MHLLTGALLAALVGQVVCTPIVYEQRILGGGDADPNEFYFFVGLYTATDDEFFCGGSLISQDYIVTAAHCMNIKTNAAAIAEAARGSSSATKGLITRKAADIMVVVGPTKHSVSERLTVAEVTVHADYNQGGDWENDIALLKLTTTLPLNDTLKPVPIYAGQLTQGDIVQAGGMGVTDLSANERSKDLMAVDLPIANATLCQGLLSSYQDSNGPVVCAGGLEGKDTCMGDSGGPLVKKDSSGKVALVGLTSFGGSIRDDGPTCGAHDGAGIYTHLIAFLDWIMGITQLPAESLVDASSAPVTNASVQ